MGESTSLPATNGEPSTVSVSPLLPLYTRSAAHAAIVFALICGLAERGEAHDDVAAGDVGIVDHPVAAHAGGHGRVHDDGAHQVAHVGGLASGAVDLHSVAAHGGQQLLGAVDDGCDHLAGDQLLVAPDGGGYQHAVGGAHAEQVVDIHYQRILRYTFPHREVARLFPVGVGQRRFGAGAVGVHYVAPFGVAAQDVGDDLAESLGKDSLVYILDGGVHIFFCSGNTAEVVTL